MELSHVKGLGPAKQESLKAAGIKTVEALADLDLRKDPEVPGVSKDALKNYKQRARQTLRAGNGGNQASTAKKSAKKTTKGTAKKSAKKSTKGTAKKTTKGTAKKSAKKSTKNAGGSKSTSGNTPTKSTSGNGSTKTTSGSTSGSTKTTSGSTSTGRKGGSNKKGWLRRILKR